MSDLFGNHIVGFPTRRLNFLCRNPEILDECEIDEHTKEVLLENIKRRLTPQSVKIRAGIVLGK